MSIRNSAKAVIINSGKILVNVCYDKYNGKYFSLPGGGQNPYETLQDAVIRECLEETGYNVFPVRFAALFEEICDHQEFREKYPDYAHKLYHIFVCNLEDEKIKIPTEKDAVQTGNEWVDVNHLNAIRLLPKAVGDNILKIINSNSPIYLGSEHILFNHG